MNPDLQQERDRATFRIDPLTHLLDGGGARTERRRSIERIIARDPTGIFDNSQNSYLPRTQRHIRAMAKHVRMVELCHKLGMVNDEVDDDDETSGKSRGGKSGGDNSNGNSNSNSNGSKRRRSSLLIDSPDFPFVLDAIADDLPTALHWVMFVPNIVALCDEQQQAEWLPQCQTWQMIGCYAQTELGHGSNVRALETTATFQSEDQCKIKGGGFVIHSPTLTSGKFWPGSLGKTANHAMVIARLIDGQGIDRGIHNFLVPLRSLTTHELLPGVTTGDVGPKIGYNNMDNGYAYFDHVRIPRRNMAMKFATVDEAGNYHQLTGKESSAASKVAYITMMQVRAMIVLGSSKALAIGTTIVVRYSAVRKQGYDEDDDNDNRNGTSNTSTGKKRELSILDYTQQQHRILPLVAASYAFFFVGRKLSHKLKAIERNLLLRKEESGAAGAGTATPLTKVQVADIHASSSALKSFCTTIAADGLEDCRKACGGHGYLMCSGLPELIQGYLQSPTVEGDNHMLPQQVLKVLLKLVDAVRASLHDDEGTKTLLAAYETCDSFALIPSLQSILLEQEEQQQRQQQQRQSPPNGEDIGPATTIGAVVVETCSAITADDLFDLQVLLLSAHRHVAARWLVIVAQQLNDRMSPGKGKGKGKGMSLQQAWNDSLIAMAQASKAYSMYLILEAFCHGIRDEQTNANNSLLGPDEVNVLVDCATLLGLYWLEQYHIGTLVQDGYMSVEQSQWIPDCVLRSLKRLRPNAVALVDARDISDFRLKSALGRYDGNVYPEILKAAKMDPLNAVDPGPAYEPALKRLIHTGGAAWSGTASRL